MANSAPADSGVYLLALELARSRTLTVGALGSIRFERGWYVYVGSARRGLARRLARHERRRNGKRLRWHIDFLRVAARATRAFPLHTWLDLECRLAQDTKRISDGEVLGFGCSDCACQSHLFRFPRDPLKDARFLALVRRYRHEYCDGSSGRLVVRGQDGRRVAPAVDVGRAWAR